MAASKARREAARKRDAEIAAKAAEALADPQIGERIAALVDTATPRFLRYSVRNQALLLRQAEERGMTITDVDTFKGWLRRGRIVRRGEKGLRIVRPVGRTVAEDGQDVEDVEESTDVTAEQEDKVFFRTAVRFDISQTDPIEGAEVDQAQADTAEDTAEDTADPAAALFTSLREQAERAGYLVTVPADDEPHTEAVSIDRDARTIFVYEEGREALARFAGIVAEILGERHRARQEGKAADRGAEDVEVITVL